MAAVAAADMPSYDSSDPGKQRNSNSDDSFDSTMKFCTRCRTNRPISIFRGKRKKMVKDCATYLQTTTTAGGVASGTTSQGRNAILRRARASREIVGRPV